MNKFIIVFCIFITAIFFSVIVSLNHPIWKPFRCNTHVSSHITSKDGKKIELNLNINVVTAQKGRSEILAIGTLDGLSKNYDISRRIFISIKESGFKNFTKTMIIREERHPIDNIPDDIWQQYVLPEAPGVEFYMETKRLGKNLFLIKGLTNPFFVCTVVES